MTRKRELPKDLLKSIQTDSSVNVLTAWTGYCDQMRRQPQLQLAKALILFLPKVATAYGARQVLDDYTLEKCVDLVLNRFSFLGLNELDEAFECAAAGVLDIELKLYGSFDAAVLGAVLGAYTNYRKSVIAKIENEIKRRSQELESEEIKAKNEAVLTAFPSELEAKRDSIESWKDVPVFWSRLAWKLGMISMSEEQRKIYFQTALPIARIQVLERISSVTHIAKVAEMKAFKSGGKVDEIKERAAVIARKMIVFDSLILPYKIN